MQKLHPGSTSLDTQDLRVHSSHCCRLPPAQELCARHRAIVTGRFIIERAQILLSSAAVTSEEAAASDLGEAPSLTPPRGLSFSLQ